MFFFWKPKWIVLDRVFSRSDFPTRLGNSGVLDTEPPTPPDVLARFLESHACLSQLAKCFPPSKFLLKGGFLGGTFLVSPKGIAGRRPFPTEHVSLWALQSLDSGISCNIDSHHTMWMIQLLNEPYPLNSVRKMAWFAVYVAIFVILFLTFFQPFGLGSSSLFGLLKVTVTYGLITFFTILAATITARWAFPRFFVEQHWVFGRELLVVMVNFFLIGVFNSLYSNYMFHIGLSIREFLAFQLYTVGVGFFPILFYMMLKYTHLLRSNVRAAGVLSGDIKKSLASEAPADNSTLRIQSELKKDDLEIPTKDFLLAETADNYILVHYLVGGNIQKQMVRSTLAKLETAIGGHPGLLRCHRAFIVNLDFVESFKGNAQGLQLSLMHLDQEVPVSRNMVDTIRQKLRG